MMILNIYKLLSEVSKLLLKLNVNLMHIVFFKYIHAISSTVFRIPLFFCVFCRWY